MRDGEIEQSLAGNFGIGLLSFSEDRDYTTVECATARVDVKDGVADFEEKLAAQLTEVTWMGDGQINLNTEELGVGIPPKTKQGHSDLCRNPEQPCARQWNAKTSESTA